MRVMIGVCVTLVLALGLSVWQLRGAWADADLANQGRQQAEKTLAEQRQETEKLTSRFDDLDRALGSLAQSDAQQANRLQVALVGIQNIQKSEGDSDAAIECLDVRVPRQLADWVR